jgi:hypothetical protein
MQSKWWDSLAALDGFMSALRAENVSSHGIVHVFDSNDNEYIARNGTIDSWQPFSTDPIGAHWGSTPLYDAINIMGRSIRDLDPARASIIIITDGEENGSRFTDHTQARAILDWLRAKGYQVTFLGADFNNNSQARQLGANESNTLGIAKARLAEAGKLLGQKRANNAKYGNDINFSSDEKSTFGGYLARPEAGEQE